MELEKRLLKLKSPLEALNRNHPINPKPKNTIDNIEQKQTLGTSKRYKRALRCALALLASSVGHS